MPASLPRHSILGVGVNAVDYRDATNLILDAAREKRPFAATALAVHGVMTGHDDPAHALRLNRLDLVTPDGQPVRWALNWLYGAGLADRVYGPFLMLRLCERAAAEGLRVFLYGSDAATLQELAPGLVRRFPGLQVAGTQPSRFRRATAAEWSEDEERLRQSGADLVFCGLGCPKQEVWVYEMRGRVGCPLVAVGAAFSFLGGRQKMAPRWMQHAGLEWLFRLAREPRRLWKRYLLLNPRYASGIVLQKLRGKPTTASPESAEPEPLHWS